MTCKCHLYSIDRKIRCAILGEFWYITVDIGYLSDHSVYTHVVLPYWYAIQRLNLRVSFTVRSDAFLQKKHNKSPLRVLRIILLFLLFLMLALCFTPWFSIESNITTSYWGYYSLPSFLLQFLVIASVLVRKQQRKCWLYTSAVCTFSLLPTSIYHFIYWRLYMNITKAPLTLSDGIRYTFLGFWCFSIVTTVFCILFQFYLFKSLRYQQ